MRLIVGSYAFNAWMRQVAQLGHGFKSEPSEYIFKTPVLVAQRTGSLRCRSLLRQDDATRLTLNCCGLPGVHLPSRNN